MNRRRVLAGFGVGLATTGAGCSSGDATPAPSGGTVTVTFQNESDWTLVFTAAAIPDGMDGVTIEYRDGSERTLEDVQTVDDIPASAWDGAVTFTPGADAPRRQFRSTGRSGMSAEFPNLPAGTTVVTTVTRPSVANSMRSLGAGTCGDADVMRVAVAVDATGSAHLHTTCETRGQSRRVV
jgi:hypothetical protein